jgi:response regulator RpfG family c-di-GMP phosphodiesterase
MPMTVENSSSGGRRKVTILIVDNLDIQRIVARLLGRTWDQDDYMLVATTRTDEAERLLGEYRVDLLVTALRVLPSNGVRFANSVRADCRYSHIPIVFHTAAPYECLEYEGLALGAGEFGYVKKPSSPAEMFAVFEKAMNNAGKPLPRRNWEWGCSHEPQGR